MYISHHQHHRLTEVGQIGVDMEHVVQVVVLVNKHEQEVVRNQHQVMEVTNVKDHHNDNEIVT